MHCRALPVVAIASRSATHRRRLVRWLPESYVCSCKQIHGVYCSSKVEVEWEAVLLHNRAWGSNLGPKTRCPDRLSAVFHFLQTSDVVLRQIVTSSFHIIYIVTGIQKHYCVIRYKLLSIYFPDRTTNDNFI